MSKNKDLLRDLSQTLQSDVLENNTRKIPPLQKWNPVHRSNLNIVILDNGDWHHEGRKMTRQSLVDLFASVLWVEKDKTGQKIHYLKTPSDLYQIQVVDTPLFISQVQRTEQAGKMWIELITTHGDRFFIDDERLPYFDFFNDEERLYVDVRFGLKARFFNAAFFHLIEMGELEQVQHSGSVTTSLKLISGDKNYSITSKSTKL